jgi:hypothetical protein
VRWKDASARSSGTKRRRSSAATHQRFGIEVGRLAIRETAKPMNGGATSAKASNSQSAARGAWSQRSSAASAAAARAICRPEKTSRW